MTYYGIATPGPVFRVWWIGASAHEAWMSFFTYPDQRRGQTLHRLPIEEAIRAYEGIGYRCVELEVREKLPKASCREAVLGRLGTALHQVQGAEADEELT